MAMYCASDKTTGDLLPVVGDSGFGFQIVVPNETSWVQYPWNI